MASFPHFRLSLALATFAAPAVLHAAGFPNIARPVAGQLLSGLEAPMQGRTAVIAWHNGLLYTIPESPGSLAGSDQQVRSWDLANPADPLELAQLGVSRGPISAHGYFYRDDALVIGDNIPGAPWSFRATATYGVNTRTTYDEISPIHGVGDRGALYHPFHATMWWSYSPVSGLARLSRNHVVTAEWDHLALTGVVGHPIIFGNLLIYAADQSRTGVAIYDISDLSNPVLLSTLKEGGPGGYWPELWGGGGKLYIVWPYQNNAFNDGAPGFRVVDITDPANPHWVVDRTLPANGDEPMYIQFQDEFAFIANHKIDLRSFDVVLSLASEANGIDTSQFALPLGNLLVTGGYGDQQGMAVWVHQTAPDTRGPEVGFHLPRAGQTNYPVSAPISLLIHETLEVSTIVNGTTFRVRPLDAEGNPGAFVAGRFTFAFDDTLTFTPNAPLAANTTYLVDIPANGIRDAAGNAMAPFSFTFSTGTLVSGNTPPVITSLTADSPVIAPGGSLTFTTTATDAPGQALQYRFDAGDGRPKTDWTDSASVAFTYTDAGHYQVLVQVRDPLGALSSRTLGINVLTTPAGPRPTQSAPVAVNATARRLWTVNPDTHTVTALHADTLATLFEVPVPADPRSVALDANGHVWVTCHDADLVVVLDAATGATLATLPTGHGSAPFGVAFSPDRLIAYVSLTGSGRLHRYNATTRALTGNLALGPTARALAVSGDGARILVTRFISPPNHGEIWEVNAATFMVSRTLRIPKFGGQLHLDGSANGRGVPNYLASVAIAPDNLSAWVVATKANTERGTLFGAPLNHENTQRTVLARLSLDAAYPQGLVTRDVDLDNSDSASALAFSPLGDYLFVTLQGNNQVAVFDVPALESATGLSGLLSRRETEAAPQGVALDPSTGRVFVHNFLGRSLTAINAADLFATGNTALPSEHVPTILNETVPSAVLAGKRLFYDASDSRMSAEGYISCASCHVDGGTDGRVWDFTQRGEGLRRTPELRGRAGLGHGALHWTANFDELQDFEHDIRSAFGGTGFLAGNAATFAANEAPLGTPKAGRSPELDALAAYITSLGRESLPRSPHRAADGTLTVNARAGRTVFQALDCRSCHSTTQFTDSRPGTVPLLHNVGTLRTTSGQRLGAALPGIDTPTLLGAWANPSYLHDGSARTLEDVFTVAGGTVIQAETGAASHGNIEVGASNLTNNFDRSVTGGFVNLEGGGVGTLTLSNVNGGPGGVGAIEFRYSMTGFGLSAFVRVNGVNHVVALPSTNNLPSWRQTFWSTARVEGVALTAGATNTIQVGPQSGWNLGIDHVTISTATHLAAAAPHRAVQTLAPAERTALLDFLRQLDRTETYVAPYADYAGFAAATLPPAASVDPLADPDGNGLPNILEYAFAPVTTQPVTLTIQPPAADPTGPSHLHLTFRARKGASDLAYQIELSNDLATWTPGARYTPNDDGAVLRDANTASLAVSAQDEGDTVLLTERDATPIDSSTTRRFARVRIDRIP